MADDAAPRIQVERFGGFGGFGLPGSRVRSLGQVDLSTLDPADRATVERLLSARRPPRAGAGADRFVYRLTPLQADGQAAAAPGVEVPEEALPAAVAACVRDELL